MKTRLWYPLSTMWLALAAVYLVLRMIYGFKVGGIIPVLVGLSAGLIALALAEYYGHKQTKRF